MVTDYDQIHECSLHSLMVKLFFMENSGLNENISKDCLFKKPKKQKGVKE